MRFTAYIMSGQREQEQDDANAGALAVFHVRFGCPGQELGNVGGFLVDGSLGAVGIGHLVVRSGGAIAILWPGKYLLK